MNMTYPLFSLITQQKYYCNPTHFRGQIMVISRFEMKHALDQMSFNLRRAEGKSESQIEWTKRGRKKGGEESIWGWSEPRRG